MSAQPERLAVVVVNYGSSALLQSNLVAVQEAAAHAGMPAQVVVVDNRTDDAERAAVRALAGAHGWIVVESAQNRGFGGGVNLGMRRALEEGASDALVINPDARIGADALRALARHIAADRTALASPIVRGPDGSPWFAGVDLLLEDGTMRARRKRPAGDTAPHRPWLSGACLWITREVWELSGGFDEEYFLYWEDVDFSQRVIEGGGSLLLAEDASAVHEEGGTQRDEAPPTRAKSEGYYFYNIRNRMLYARRHLDAAAVERWRRAIPRTAREIILRGGRRQLLTSLAPWRAYVRGVREARRLVRG